MNFFHEEEEEEEVKVDRIPTSEPSRTPRQRWKAQLAEVNSLNTPNSLKDLGDCMPPSA